MNDKLFIPTKCKVGFNPRSDTYSGKLAYVIGLDGKKWRKETSWDGWIYKYTTSAEFEAKKKKSYDDRVVEMTKRFNDMVEYLKTNTDMSNWNVDSYTKQTKGGLEQFLTTYVGSYERYNPNLGRTTNDPTMEAYEFDNVPTAGFVLNKKVGGYSSGWNHRQTYARIYDPRGFEFEITMDNLLFILQECNSIKGKALEGEFVYSWGGKDLVLLPASSSDYQSSMNFSKVQQTKISTKDLIIGHEYLNKSMEKVVYVGRLPYMHRGGNYNYLGNKHVFYIGGGKGTYNNGYYFLDAMATISSKTSDTIADNFGDILTDFDKRFGLNDLKHSFSEYKMKSKTSRYYNSSETCYIKKNDNEFIEASIKFGLDLTRGYSYEYPIKTYAIKSRSKITFENGGITIRKYDKESYVLSPKDIDTLTFVQLNTSHSNKKMEKTTIH